MLSYNPRPAALSLIETGELSVEELWIQYRARGGNAGELELDAFIHDIPLMHGMEIEILQVTVDELLPTPPAARKAMKNADQDSASSASPQPPPQHELDLGNEPKRLSNAAARRRTKPHMLAIRNWAAALHQIAGVMWNCVHPGRKA